MIIGELCSFIESIAPLPYQESYDNAGLLVGNRNSELKGVLICLDSIEAVLDEAIELGCNLVLAHHPIVFSGLKKFNGKSYIERVIMKAIKNDIAIYAAHTNLDNMLSNGVNAKIAEKIGLVNTKILAPKKGILKKLFTYVPTQNAAELMSALFAVGAGQIGNYSECSFSVKGVGTFKANEKSNPFVGKIGERHQETEEKLEVIFPEILEGKLLGALKQSHPYEEVAYEIISLDNEYQEIGAGLIGELPKPISSIEFLQQLKKSMQTACIRYTSLHKEQIQRVALCGGSGSFLLKDAIAAQADIFITGDFKYHQFFDAENRIIIADIGHFESEQFTIDLFYELITQNFSNFAVHTTKIRTNPINYL